jgi:asparagine synthase (glutamine-hydrolysing)
MCGFSGVVFSSSSNFAADPQRQRRFLSQALFLEHRGNEPFRHFLQEHLYLSHVRLSFQDSSTNLQPMLSQNKKWVIVFNGEIYNFQKLRSHLKASFGHTFVTKGDTEVILAAFQHHCFFELQHLLEGEYSFVICRTDGSELFAMRDPFGVKPLFFALEDISTALFACAKETYHFNTKSLQFASEMKGLAQPKIWDKEGFLKQFVGLFEPIRTPFQHIIQLPPHSFLHARQKNQLFEVQLRLKHSPIRSPSRDLVFSNEPHLREQCVQHVRKSVVDRILSQRELGVYLSGGIDSLVVAFETQKALQKHSVLPLKAFTLSFQEKKYSERSQALAFAEEWNLALHVLEVSKTHLQYAYPHAVYFSENIQPYTNGAAKWWLSRFVGSVLKGVLTGDGADELFCGYPSFRYASWWKFALRARPEKNIFDKIKKHPLLGSSCWRDRVYFKKFTKHTQDPWLAGSSAAGSGQDFVESLELWGVPHPLFGQIKAIASFVLGHSEALKWLAEQQESVSSWFSFGFSEGSEFLQNSENTLLLWQNYFSKTHLPVQILNWVGDRMEMANTVEGRTPFLSKEVRNFIFNLKDFFLVRGFEEKSLLRRSYEKILGGSFSKRPKKQFGAPFLFQKFFQGEVQKENVMRLIKETGVLDPHIIASFLSHVNKSSFHSAHEWAHVQSCCQTLMCFALVEQSLVQERRPERQLAFEESVLFHSRKS